MTVEAPPENAPTVWNRPLPTQRPFKIAGILSDGALRPSSQSLPVADCAPRIAEHLEHLADWSAPGWKVGDYNQYIVGFTLEDGVDLFVVLTSEPQDDVRVQIEGGGTPVRGVHHHHLRRFGFLPTMETGQWRRTLRITSAQEALAVAKDLVALLVEGFGYRGTSPLGFTLTQNQHAEVAPVYRTLRPEDLRKLLLGWGYRADLGTTSNGNPVIQIATVGFKFHILFAWPTADSHHFGCLNFLAIYQTQHSIALSMVNTMSRSSRFVRLYLDDEGDLILERDVSLTGGVSADYVHECLLDWAGMLEAITRKLSKTTEPPPVVH